MATKFTQSTMKFACTQCGRCCRQRGKSRVYVNSAEVSAIATQLKLDRREFVQTYTEQVEHGKDILIALKLKSNNLDNRKRECVFLENNKCTVYENRPVQCQTYPYWPQLLLGEAELRAEAQLCEGITFGSEQHAGNLQDDAIKNLIIKTIHDRGLGPDWMYSEAKEYLEESLCQDPQLLQGFTSEFFSTHFSHSIYSSDKLVVVDTTVPVESHTQSSDDFSALNDSSNLHLELSRGQDDIANAISGLAVTIRRLSFQSSLGITQSEAILGSNGKVLVNFLSLEIHRAIVSVFKRFMSSTLPKLIKVAVIGAGGCSLPNYLLQSSAKNGSIIHIDAIEPDQEIIHIAENYFQTTISSSHQQSSSSLVVLNMTGDEFINSTNKSESSKYDFIIIDAQDCEDSVSTAPPLSMIQKINVQDYQKFLSENGVLLVNVLGDA